MYLIAVCWCRTHSFIPPILRATAPEDRDGYESIGRGGEGIPAVSTPHSPHPAEGVGLDAPSSFPWIRPRRPDFKELPLFIHRPRIFVVLLGSGGPMPPPSRGGGSAPPPHRSWPSIPAGGPGNLEHPGGRLPPSLLRRSRSPPLRRRMPPPPHTYSGPSASSTPTHNRHLRFIATSNLRTGAIFNLEALLSGHLRRFVLGGSCFFNPAYAECRKFFRN